MTWQDAVNGAFELYGAIAIAQHCLALYRHKMVRGASYAALAFFFSWGVWNLYYYPHLGQWASFAGGCAIVTANAVYLGMVIYYTLRERRACESVREANEHA